MKVLAFSIVLVLSALAAYGISNSVYKGLVRNGRKNAQVFRALIFIVTLAGIFYVGIALTWLAFFFER